MAVLVGKKAPNFNEKAVQGTEIIENFTLSQFKGKYVVLFFYPLDFTFVCPTELHAFNAQWEEFQELNTELVAVSTDSWFSHSAWLSTPKSEGGIQGVRFPIVADFNKRISADYDVLLEEGMALRGLFLIDRDGVVQHQIVNNLDLGRSVEETIRMVRALQHTELHGEVCPAGWNHSQDALEASSEGIKKYFSTE